MHRSGDGWHEITLPSDQAGTRYCFELPDGTCVADPASGFQPEGATGLSAVVDLQRYAWQHTRWKGRPWHEAVIYELHVGSFTTAGTFAAATKRLPYLAELGITAVELMPVAQCGGSRNWGYDGVQLYAPSCNYGTPQDLQALVDAAHGLGLMVYLDVVYNHFGPVGNSLAALCPSFFDSRLQTPWGAGIDFSKVPVRQFFIDNAFHWLQHYRFDGLRFDAVHAIVDDSAEHIIDSIARTIRSWEGERPVHLILENEHNEASRLRARQAGAAHFDAQWNDDVHHVLHVAATGESEGYYADYAKDPPLLPRALAQGFAYQGELMHYRGSPRGEPSAHLPPTSFVAFMQNHDQIGNRAFGERLATLTSVEALGALAAIALLSPQVPMLFMGEEWGATQPFPFFCGFTGELGQAVAAGRRKEFARFSAFADEANRERIPDPTAWQTFASAQLDWSALAQSHHQSVLQRYRDLLQVRREQIIPLLPRIARGGNGAFTESGCLEVRWKVDGIGALLLNANLGEVGRWRRLPARANALWLHGDVRDDYLGAWAVEWSLATGPEAANG